MYYIDIRDDEDVDASFVEDSLDKILNRLNEPGDFSISFIDDDEMKAMNNEYRNIDAPTDILTFRLDDEDSFPQIDEGEKELGDIFISIDSMKRNANEFGVDEENELRRLLLHGILHLRGLDHKSNDFNTEPMLIEQEKLLKEIF